MLKEHSLKISVIIATKDRYESILNCLRSIYSQTYLPFETIIVDSSKDERLKNEIEKIGNADIRLKYIRSAPGLTLQRNVGVKAATGDLFAFFDDDIILNDDFLEKIVFVFAGDTDKKIGGVTGRITNEIIPKWSIIGMFRFLTFFSYPSYGQVRISGFNTEYNWCKKPLKVEWLYGAVTVYRKEVFDEFSFDENLKGYGYNEDLDFSYRVSSKYECWYIPSAKVLHHKSGSRLSPEIARAMIVNSNYLLHKNILPDKSLAMKFLHITTFYIAIFSFLFYLFITGSFSTFKGGMIGLEDAWFRKSSFH